MKAIPMRARSFRSKLYPRLAPALAIFWAAASFCTLLLVGGCKVSAEKVEYQRAEEAAQKNQYEQALKHYEAVVAAHVKTPLALKSAKEAANLLHYQLKRPKEAVEYYKHIILHSQDSKERIAAQKALADLHFTETLDYTQAIAEYSRLIELPHTQKEDLDYRLAIARSYFYQNNFFQSQVEIDTIINRSSDKNMLFDALLLKANLLLSQKKHEEAIAVLNQLINEYPEKSKTEAVGLILAVCYEEQKNYAKAIETLNSIRDSYPRRAFLDQKIKTLRERQTLLPGARGLKK